MTKEICRVSSNGNIFAFQRDSNGEGDWVCVEKPIKSKSLVGLNSIPHRAFQSELNSLAIENGINPSSIMRRLPKEIKRVSAPKPVKAVGRVIKIFSL